MAPPVRMLAFNAGSSSLKAELFVNEGRWRSALRVVVDGVGRQGAALKVAGKAAVEGTLTDSSKREQSSAGLDRLTPHEYAAFTRTNAAYRERFGFPFVVCAREHTKESILRVASERLSNSEDEEIRVALEEIAKIARLRLEEVL